MMWTPDKSLRLLLIDDDDIDGQLLRIYLSKISQSIEFSHCLEEKEALQAVASEEFDLIFVDNRLTIWTGPEMLEALRRQGYKGPTVLYSGTVDATNLDRLHELDCHDFLEKGDVSINTLRDTIQSALLRASNN